MPTRISARRLIRPSPAATFDVVIATYGRIRIVAEAFAGKTGQFIGIGGFPAYRGFFVRPPISQSVCRSRFPRLPPPFRAKRRHRFSYLIASTEQAVLGVHPRGAYFRYPYVYGPYQLVPREWCVIRRILDRRPFMILADGGLT